MPRTLTYRACPVCGGTVRASDKHGDAFAGKVGAKSIRPVVEVDIEYGRRSIRFVARRGPDECQGATPPHETRPRWSRKDWLERLKVAVMKAAAALGCVSERAVKKVEKEVYPERFARQYNEAGHMLWEGVKEHSKRRGRRLTRGVGRPGRARGLRVADGGYQRFGFAVPGRDGRARGMHVLDGHVGHVALSPAPHAARDESRVIEATVADAGIGAVSLKR